LAYPRASMSPEKLMPGAFDPSEGHPAISPGPALER